VVRNDWTTYSPAPTAEWTPSTTVTVIVPDGVTAEARAALGEQTYPSGLVEFIDPTSTLGTGSVIVHVDENAVPGPDFLRALVRWPAHAPEAVAVAIGAEPAEPLSRQLSETSDLVSADTTAFHALIGGSFAVSRALVDRAGTMVDSSFETAFRFAQAGAVIVPEREAQFKSATALEPVDTDERPLAPAGVPLVTAIVHFEGSGPEAVQELSTCVSRLLSSRDVDQRIVVVAPRTAEVAGVFRHTRINVTSREPDAVQIRSPFVLRVPVALRLGHRTVRSLCDAADRWRVGLVHALPAGTQSSELAAELWRTAAISRAMWDADSASGQGTGSKDLAPADLAERVAQCYGERWVSGLDVDVRAAAPQGPTAPAKPRSGNRRSYLGGVDRTNPTVRLRALLAEPLPVSRRFASVLVRRVLSRSDSGAGSAN
jgi:hypothetical protein